jgi:hypothetical protein
MGMTWEESRKSIIRCHKDPVKKEISSLYKKGKTFLAMDFVKRCKNLSYLSERTKKDWSYIILAELVREKYLAKHGRQFEVLK